MPDTIAPDLAAGQQPAAPAIIPHLTRFSQPRTAVVHYWLVGMRGGERVLERILRLHPGADLFTHVHVPEAMSATIRAHKVHTSFIQKLPGAQRHYQKYLPLMPLALEQLDLTGYDLVLSSESGPAKGVIARPDARHLAYVHSPMRYLWDHYHDYRGPAGRLTRAVMPFLFHYLRSWDTASAARVDSLVANSHFIRRRIARAWGRTAEVVHPPVATNLFTPADSADVTPRYLWVGQMIAYKRPDVVVEAFNRLGLPLLMVGDGDLFDAVSRKAGPNVQVVRRLGLDGLARAYATCRALVFAAEEDFGIVPVEANAAGRPVLAYGRGGILDSIVPGETGLFFAEQSAEAIMAGVDGLEQWMPHFDPAAAVANAARFAPEHFDAGYSAAVERALASA
jgi:glycosyltransferase involved in cell wall biosynthesis